MRIAVVSTLLGLAITAGLSYVLARWGDCALADLGPDGCLAP